MRWSPPRIAGEPILPTPAMMRTHGTGWTRRRFCLRQSLRQWKHLNILPSPVGDPVPTKRAPCHIHPSHWPKKHRLTLKRRSLGQETADYTHPTSPVAFGLWRQALLSQSTALTISLIGEIDGPLGERIFLPHFAQPQACPRWTTELAILPASVKASAVKRPVARPDSPAHCHGPYASGGSSHVKKSGAVSVGDAHSISRSSPPCIIFPSERRRFHTH